MLDIQSIEVSELFNLLKADPETILVDVREENEIAEISTQFSKSYPLSTLQVGKVLDDLNLHEDSSQNIYIICRSGKRSMHAALMFKESGFNNVVNVTGGMLEWIQEGFPTV